MDNKSFTEMTKDWSLYESGKNYNQRLRPNYYETVDANIDFYAGNQWRNSENTMLMKPVFNIIKRILMFFTASLTSSKITVQFENLKYKGQEDDIIPVSEIMNAEVRNLFEKHNMDNRIKDAITQAGVKGDVALHVYFDPTKKPYNGFLKDVEGEICMELVSGTNVFFGNANNHSVEEQPYIIISGRDMVSNLKAEAKLYKQNNLDISQITADYDYQYEPSDAGQIEVDADEYGKALFIIKYYRDPKTKTIKVSKSVKSAYIYEDIDTGLTYYPVSWLVWEKQENQYHGRAMVTGIIPNQIFINKMFAMVMYNLMMTSFPKAVYNSDYVSGWSNEIGTAIPISGVGINENIKNIAGYLETGNMSGQITQVIDMAMAYTKESLGINDVVLGNINPTNTSAIVAVQRSTTIPLENIRANMYEWLEDTSKILVDMIGTYYGIRPIIIKTTESSEIVEYDFNKLKDVYLHSKVDIGESSYWSEIASVQTLDNLLQLGQLDIVSYLERVPDGYIPKRQELINVLRAKQQEAEQMAMQQMGGQVPEGAMAPPQGLMEAPEEMEEESVNGINLEDKLPDNISYEEMAQYFEQLPPEVQAEIQALPPEEQEKKIANLILLDMLSK